MAVYTESFDQPPPLHDDEEDPIVSSPPERKYESLPLPDEDHESPPQLPYAQYDHPSPHSEADEHALHAQPPPLSPHSEEDVDAQQPPLRSQEDEQGVDPPPLSPRSQEDEQGVDPPPLSPRSQEDEQGVDPPPLSPRSQEDEQGVGDQHPPPLSPRSQEDQQGVDTQYDQFPPSSPSHSPEISVSPPPIEASTSEEYSEIDKTSPRSQEEHIEAEDKAHVSSPQSVHEKISSVSSDYEIVEVSDDGDEVRPQNGVQSSYRPSKYSAHTRSPSDGDDIRWYFCKAPLDINEVAASVPKTEVVGKGDFFRFSVRDSLSLEESFLKREEELVALWWREYAECSEGPSKSKKHEDDSSPTFKKLSSEFFEEAVGVPVKGGLYEVDLDSRRCFPVYWGGEHRRVLRGHWFAQRGGVDWLPLREDIAEQLEFAYRSRIWLRRSFQPSGQFAARLDFQGATQGLHALFTGEEDTWEAWLHVDASGISSMFGLKGSGFKLRRGFKLSDLSHLSQDELHQKKEEEMDDYCSEVPVRHLVFMVHGIGQRLEKANLVDDVGTFRRITAMLAEKHLTEYQRRCQRVLFIPCQWRRHLKLGGEAAVENCTLEGVRALRTMIGATVHDVLYYMSPIYCQDIIDSVSSSLNRLYEKFMRRNPGYDGKISVYGHSLGSVLSYDILCHQEELTSLFPIQEVNLNVDTEVPNEVPEQSEEDLSGRESSLETETIESLRAELSLVRSKLKALEKSQPDQLQSAPSRRHHTPRITYTKLQFQIDTFFAVGSPLGLFLGLRNVRIGIGMGHEYWEDEGIEEEMPACRQMMNIFHPYDPVAYRVEPLISKEYVQKRPVFIPYHKGGKRLHIGMQELGEDLGAKSRALVSSIASVGSRVANAFSSPDAKSHEDIHENKEERSYGSLVMERLTGSPDGRVDYMLQDATFEHQYISAISSHTNYWRDLDTALFIVRHLYRDIPEKSPSKVRAEEEAKNRLLAEFGGYIENDAPLTFSSKEGIAAEMAAAEKNLLSTVDL